MVEKIITINSLYQLFVVISLTLHTALGTMPHNFKIKTLIHLSILVFRAICNNVNPRLSPCGLICKKSFIVGAYSKGGLFEGRAYFNV